MTKLYHASPNINLKLLEPQHTLSKNKYIGDYIFATADKRLAVMYLATKGLATLMNPESEPWIVICSDEKEYVAGDKGGAIYELPGSSFIKSPQEKLGPMELVSVEPVKPIRKTIYQKSLAAILELGAEIYFVNSQTFDELVAAKDKQKILSTLRSYKST